MKGKNQPRGFTLVPNWVFTSEAFSTGYDRWMFVVMLSFADSQGKCYPSARAIAARAKFSRNTVARALDRLEEAGLLKRSGRIRADGGRGSNEYTLTLAAPESAGMGDKTFYQARRASNVPKPEQSTVSDSEAREKPVNADMGDKTFYQASESSPQPELEPEQPQPEQPVQEPQPKPQPKPQPEQETLFDEPVKPEIVPTTAEIVPTGNETVTTTAGTIDFRRNDYPDAFEQLWRIWPKKASKKDAYKAWKKTNLGISRANLSKAAAAWVQMKRLQEPMLNPKYIPNLATWINGEKWEELGEQENYIRHTEYKDLSNAGKFVASQDPETQAAMMKQWREDRARFEKEHKDYLSQDHRGLADMSPEEREAFIKANRFDAPCAQPIPKKPLEEEEKPTTRTPQRQATPVADFGGWFQSVE